MDAPELKAVRAVGPLGEPTDPLQRYVRHETPSAAVLRDQPFGSQPTFGGETPFFTQAEISPETNWDLDDTEGIPTGLPDLLHLPPEAESATSSTIETTSAQENALAPDLLPEPLHTVRSNEPTPIVALFLGMGLSSIVWMVVIASWNYLRAV